jgi:hypothetical protein
MPSGEVRPTGTIGTFEPAEAPWLGLCGHGGRGGSTSFPSAPPFGRGSSRSSGGGFAVHVSCGVPARAVVGGGWVSQWWKAELVGHSIEVRLWRRRRRLDRGACYL